MAFIAAPLGPGQSGSAEFTQRVASALVVLLFQNLVLVILLFGGHVTRLLECGQTGAMAKPEGESQEAAVEQTFELVPAAEALQSLQNLHLAKRMSAEVPGQLRGAWSVIVHGRPAGVAVSATGVVLASTTVNRLAWSQIAEIAPSGTTVIEISTVRGERHRIDFPWPGHARKFASCFNQGAAEAEIDLRV